MRYLDLITQTLVISITAIVALFGGADLIYAILLAQLVLGPWQLLSSFVSVVLKSNQYKLKALHLLISFTYLVVLHKGRDQFPGTFYMLLLTIPAWSLALYYYFLTAIEVFRRPGGGGKFLPHLSF